MPPAVEAMVLEMRRSHPYWGARRIAFELVRKRVERAPSESAVYRRLVRAAHVAAAGNTAEAAWFRQSLLPLRAKMAHDSWAIDVLYALARQREETIQIKSVVE